MKGSSERSVVRPSGALWFGVPLVLAACVAAEAAPQGCDTLDRTSAQVRLSRLVRDGVARLAESTRRTLDPTHVTFVLFAYERQAGPVVMPSDRAGRFFPFHAQLAAACALRLDPGGSSPPTAAP